MKIPTLTRLPSHRKFSFDPRYYDPIKEDIEERTSRIEQELRQRTSVATAYSSGINGAFARRASYNKSSNMLQGVIMIALFMFIFGYLYFGNGVFYVLWLVFPIYGYFRFKQIASQRKKKRQ